MGLGAGVGFVVAGALVDGDAVEAEGGEAGGDGGVFVAAAAGLVEEGDYGVGVFGGVEVAGDFEAVGGGEGDFFSA